MDRFGSRSPSGCAQGLERWAEAYVLRLVRSERFPPNGPRRCPRCRSLRTIRWGRFSGRQRYRCHACRRTFSDLTGTPFAYSKRLGLWLPFGDCMLTGLSVRSASRLLGIDKDTAFRWRHKLIDRYAREPHAPADPAGLSGLLLPFSDKGQPPPHSRWVPRRRRGRLTVTSRLHVLFLAPAPPRSFSWSFAASAPSGFFPRAHDLAECLAPLLPPEAELVVGSLSAASRPRELFAFAREHGHRLLDPHSRPWIAWPFVRPLPGAPRSSPLLAGILAGRANALRRSWRDWMVGFRGIASIYVLEYLAWHRQVARARRRLPGDRVFTWTHPLPSLGPSRSSGGAGLGVHMLRAALQPRSTLTPFDLTPLDASVGPDGSAGP